MFSESVEMYLVTIAVLGEKGLSGPIPLSRLAEELSVQSVSVNQMIRKMDEEGLVSYLPYKGVELTDEGREKANRILRYRRLWEVFFVDQLGLPPGEAEELACRIEHDTTVKVSDRLAGFLENPVVSPTGRLIPSTDSSILPPDSLRLSDLRVGQQGEVIALKADDATTKSLQNKGLEPGVILVVEASSSKGGVLVRIQNQRVSIIKEIAEKIKVTVSETKKIYAA
ncbi:MAG: metal-dependent transcriptional regulator [Anaerolineales bacterium]|jgi:DtxR family Mn-dependent transcriptional regulator